MLKRSGAMLLMVLYSVTVLGFALNLHFCGNKVSSVKVNAPAKDCKPANAKAACKMKCCKDKHVEVKVKDAHQAEVSSSSFLSKIFSFELPKLPFEEFFLDAQNALLERLLDRGPPSSAPSQSISVFIKNCVFRI